MNEPNQSAGNDFSPEIAGAIPVKRQAAMPAAAPDTMGNPITSGGAQTANYNDAEMDRVLDDVSGKIKAQGAEKNKKPGLLSRFKKKPKPTPAEDVHNSTSKTESEPSKTQTEKATKKPRRNLAVAGLAIAVFIGLSGLAVAAFRQDAEEQQPSANQAQAASSEPSVNKSVSASDLDQLSSEISSEVDALDEAADFDSGSLEDPSLGL